MNAAAEAPDRSPGACLWSAVGVSRGEESGQRGRGLAGSATAGGTQPARDRAYGTPPKAQAWSRSRAGRSPPERGNDEARGVTSPLTRPLTGDSGTHCPAASVGSGRTPTPRCSTAPPPNGQDPRKAPREPGVWRLNTRRPPHGDPPPLAPHRDPHGVELRPGRNRRAGTSLADPEAHQYWSVELCSTRQPALSRSAVWVRWDRMSQKVSMATAPASPPKPL